MTEPSEKKQKTSTGPSRPFVELPLVQAIPAWTHIITDAVECLPRDLGRIVAWYVFPDDPNEEKLQAANRFRQPTYVLRDPGGHIGNCFVSARRGNPCAMLEFGLNMMHGPIERMPGLGSHLYRDPVEGLRWIRRAADAGNADAGEFLPFWTVAAGTTGSPTMPGAFTAVGMYLRSQCSTKAVAYARPIGHVNLLPMTQIYAVNLRSDLSVEDAAREMSTIALATDYVSPAVSAHFRTELANDGHPRDSRPLLEHLSRLGCPGFQWMLGKSHRSCAQILKRRDEVPGPHTLKLVVEDPDLKRADELVVEAARGGWVMAMRHLGDRMLRGGDDALRVAFERGELLWIMAETLGVLSSGHERDGLLEIYLPLWDAENASRADGQPVPMSDT